VRKALTWKNLSLLCFLVHHGLFDAEIKIVKIIDLTAGFHPKSASANWSIWQFLVEFALHTKSKDKRQKSENGGR
jgi:hypothetical protein